MCRIPAPGVFLCVFRAGRLLRPHIRFRSQRSSFLGTVMPAAREERGEGPQRNPIDVRSVHHQEDLRSGEHRRRLYQVPSRRGPCCDMRDELQWAIPLPGNRLPPHQSLRCRLTQHDVSEPIPPQQRKWWSMNSRPRRDPVPSDLLATGRAGSPAHHLRIAWHPGRYSRAPPPYWMIFTMPSSRSEALLCFR